MKLTQNNREWTRFESPEECAAVLGSYPNRTLVGMAQADSGDPGIVIWAEVDGEYSAPVFLPAFGFGAVVTELLASATCSKWFAEVTPSMKVLA